MMRREGKRAKRARRERVRTILALCLGPRTSKELAEMLGVHPNRLGQVIRSLVGAGVLRRICSYDESTHTVYEMTEPFKHLAGTFLIMAKNPEIEHIVTEMLEQIHPIIDEQLSNLHEHREDMGEVEQAFLFGMLGTFLHTFNQQRIADYTERVQTSFATVISDPRTMKLMDGFSFGVIT